MSSADTTRNGYSESSSGPLQRVNPSRNACAQASGAANGSAPIRTASIRDTSPEKVLGLIHTHTLRFHIYVAPGAALHSGREGADVARKRRQHISPTGWFQRLFRQPPANFYGRTSVYLSGSILEIEHFRRIRSYDDGELCLELGKGLLTIYGSQLKITALSTQRITLRGEILRTEFSRDATSR